MLDNLTVEDYRAEAARFPMVGSVPPAGGFFGGSGVLISDRWVLTAGHITDFRSGGSYVIGGVTYTIQSVITHPNHTPFSTTYDVGLLYLSTAVTGITPAKMIHLEDPASLIGKEASWVGNGLTGTGLNNDRGPNQMLGFTNVIDGYSPFNGLPGPSLFADFDNPSGTTNTLGSTSSATPTRLEGNVTPGDSGGGVFVEIDGQSYLVGTNSYASGFGEDKNSRYGAISGAADLNQFHQWIYEKTNVFPVPEPGVAVLSLLGMLVMLRRRDRATSL